MNSKYKTIDKFLALVLALTFCASEVSLAAAITPAVAERSQGIESVLRQASSFEPPLDYSMLREVHQGSEASLIIHIQDAHVNLSGQQNLAGALDAIMKKYGVSLVLVEGGSVDGTLDPIKKLASPEILKRVAKTFLMEGKISGEEYLNLTSDHPMRIIGVEDDALYMKSVKTYGELAGKRQSILETLKKIQGATAKLKRKIYPESLIEFEKKTESNWSQDDAGFEVRFKEIFAMTPAGFEASKYPAAMQFRSLQEMEKTVDFKSANLEQGILIEEISQKGGGDDLKTHLDRMSKLKNQKLSQYAYFQNTLNIAEGKGIDLSKYQNLLKYGEYLEAFSKVDLEQVLDEMERLEDEVYKSLLTTQDQKLLRSIDRYLKLLWTAYNIQMSTKDFNLFKANEPDFSTISYLAFLNRKLTELGYFEDLIPYTNLLEEGKTSLEAFYDSVTKRDFAFIENTQRILKEENQKVAVLISGGYHTPHLKKLLKSKGYSYAVLTPLVTSETNQEKYERLLLEPVKKSVKKVETVHGERKATKSTSALEREMMQAKKKSTERVRPQMAAVARAEALVGAVTSYTGKDDQATAVIAEMKAQGARLSAASQQPERQAEIVASTLLDDEQVSDETAFKPLNRDEFSYLTRKFGKELNLSESAEEAILSSLALDEQGLSQYYEDETRRGVSPAFVAVSRSELEGRGITGTGILISHLSASEEQRADGFHAALLGNLAQAAAKQGFKEVYWEIKADGSESSVRQRDMARWLGFEIVRGEEGQDILLRVSTDALTQNVQQLSAKLSADPGIASALSKAGPESKAYADLLGSITRESFLRQNGLSPWQKVTINSITRAGEGTLKSVTRLSMNVDGTEKVVAAAFLKSSTELSSSPSSQVWRASLDEISVRDENGLVAGGVATSFTGAVSFQERLDGQAIGVLFGEFVDLPADLKSKISNIKLPAKQRNTYETGVTPEAYPSLVKAMVKTWLLSHNLEEGFTDYSFANGILIGDLKLQNFILDAKSGNVKYLDLGDAQEVSFREMMNRMLEFISELPTTRLDGTDPGSLDWGSVMEGVVSAVREYSQEKNLDETQRRQIAGLLADAVSTGSAEIKPVLQSKFTEAAGILAPGYQPQTSGPEEDLSIEITADPESPSVPLAGIQPLQAADYLAEIKPALLRNVPGLNEAPAEDQKAFFESVEARLIQDRNQNHLSRIVRAEDKNTVLGYSVVYSAELAGRYMPVIDQLDAQDEGTILQILQDLAQEVLKGGRQFAWYVDNDGSDVTARKLAVAYRSGFEISEDGSSFRAMTDLDLEPVSGTVILRKRVQSEADADLTKTYRESPAIDPVRWGSVRVERTKDGEARFFDSSGALSSKKLGKGGMVDVYEVVVGGKPYAYRLPRASWLNGLEPNAPSAKRMEQILNLMVFYGEAEILEALQKSGTRQDYPVHVRGPKNLIADLREYALTAKRLSEAKGVAIGSLQAKMDGLYTRIQDQLTPKKDPDAEARRLASLAIVQELWPAGQTLDDTIALNSLEGRSFEEVNGLLRSIFDSLENLHASGIIHRDIKPLNILVREDFLNGTARQGASPSMIVDFNLSVSEDEGMRYLESVFKRDLGTPNYNPHVRDGVVTKALNKVNNERADYFGLGAVFYQILFGGPKALDVSVPSTPGKAMDVNKALQEIQSRIHAQVDAAQPRARWEGLTEDNVRVLKNFLKTLLRTNYEEPLTDIRYPAELGGDAAPGAYSADIPVSSVSAPAAAQKAASPAAPTAFVPGMEGDATVIRSGARLAFEVGSGVRPEYAELIASKQSEILGKAGLPADAKITSLTFSGDGFSKDALRAAIRTPDGRDVVKGIRVIRNPSGYGARTSQLEATAREELDMFKALNLVDKTVAIEVADYVSVHDDFPTVMVGFTVGEFVDVDPQIVDKVNKGQLPSGPNGYLTGVTPERYPEMVRTMTKTWLQTHGLDSEQMSHARARGAVIGDLKLINFVYDSKDGHVKYIDFGDTQYVHFSEFLNRMLDFVDGLPTVNQSGLDTKALAWDAMLEGIVQAFREYASERKLNPSQIENLKEVLESGFYTGPEAISRTLKAKLEKAVGEVAGARLADGFAASEARLDLLSKIPSSEIKSLSERFDLSTAKPFRLSYMSVIITVKGRDGLDYFVKFLPPTDETVNLKVNGEDTAFRLSPEDLIIRERLLMANANRDIGLTPKPVIGKISGESELALAREAIRNLALGEKVPDDLRAQDWVKNPKNWLKSDWTYMATPKVSGESVENRAKRIEDAYKADRDRAKAARQMVADMKNIIAAMADFRQKGYVHNDFGGSEIFLDKDTGRVTAILDLGGSAMKTPSNPEEELYFQQVQFGLKEDYKSASPMLWAMSTYGDAHANEYRDEMGLFLTLNHYLETVFGKEAAADEPNELRELRQYLLSRISKVTQEMQENVFSDSKPSPPALRTMVNERMARAIEEMESFFARVRDMKEVVRAQEEAPAVEVAVEGEARSVSSEERQQLMELLAGSAMDKDEAAFVAQEDARTAAERGAEPLTRVFASQDGKLHGYALAAPYSTRIDGEEIRFNAGILDLQAPDNNASMEMQRSVAAQIAGAEPYLYRVIEANTFRMSPENLKKTSRELALARDLGYEIAEVVDDEIQYRPITDADIQGAGRSTRAYVLRVAPEALTEEIAGDILLRGEEVSVDFAKETEIKAALQQMAKVYNYVGSRKAYEEDLVKLVQDGPVQIASIKIQDFKGQFNTRGEELEIGHKFGDAALATIGPHLEDRLRFQLSGTGVDFKVYMDGPVLSVIFSNVKQGDTTPQKALESLIGAGSEFKRSFVDMVKNQLKAELGNDVYRDKLANPALSGFGASNVNFYVGLSSVSAPAKTTAEALKASDRLDQEASDAAKYTQLNFNPTEYRDVVGEAGLGILKEGRLQEFLKGIKNAPQSGITNFNEALGNSVRYHKEIALKHEYAGIYAPISETYDEETTFDKLFAEYDSAIFDKDARGVQAVRQKLIQKMVLFKSPVLGSEDIIFRGNDYFKMLINYIVSKRPDGNVKVTFRVGGDEFGALVWDGRTGRLKIARFDGNNIGATNIQHGRTQADQVIAMELKIINDNIDQLENVAEAVQEFFSQEKQRGKNYDVNVTADLTDESRVYETSVLMETGPQSVHLMDTEGAVHQVYVGPDDSGQIIVGDKAGNRVGPLSGAIQARAPPFELKKVGEAYVLSGPILKDILVDQADKVEARVRQDLAAGKLIRKGESGHIVSVPIVSAPMVSTGVIEFEGVRDADNMDRRLELSVIQGRADTLAEFNKNNRIKPYQALNEGRVPQGSEAVLTLKEPIGPAELSKAIPSFELKTKSDRAIAAEDAIVQEVIRLASLRQAETILVDESAEAAPSRSAVMDEVYVLPEDNILVDEEVISPEDFPSGARLANSPLVGTKIGAVEILGEVTSAPEVRADNIRISQEKLAYDDLISPDLVIQRYQDVEGKGLDEAQAAQRIFSALNSPAGKDIFGPKHKFQVGGRTVYASNAFQVPQLSDRSAVVLYVVRADGKVDMRVAYKSSSQNEWRVMSHLVRQQVNKDEIRWIGKGEDEISMTLGIGMSTYLDTLTPFKGTALLDHVMWIPIALSSDVGLARGVGFAESMMPIGAADRLRAALDRLEVGGPFKEVNGVRTGELSDPADGPDYVNGVVSDIAAYNDKFKQDIRSVVIRSTNGKYLYRFHYRAHLDPSRRVAWLGKVESADGGITNYGVDEKVVPQKGVAEPGIEYNDRVKGRYLGVFEHDISYGYNTDYTHNLPVVKGFMDEIAQRQSPEDIEKAARQKIAFDNAASALEAYLKSDPMLYFKVLKTLRQSTRSVDIDLRKRITFYFSQEARDAIDKAIADSNLTGLSDLEVSLNLEERLSKLESSATEKIIMPALEGIRAGLDTLTTDKTEVLSEFRSALRKASSQELAEIRSKVRGVAEKLLELRTFAENQIGFIQLERRLNSITGVVSHEVRARDSIQAAESQYRKEFRAVARWMAERSISAQQAALILDEANTQAREKKEGEFLSRVRWTPEISKAGSEISRVIDANNSELMLALIQYYQRSVVGTEAAPAGEGAVKSAQSEEAAQEARAYDEANFKKLISQYEAAKDSAAESARVRAMRAHLEKEYGQLFASYLREQETKEKARAAANDKNSQIQELSKLLGMNEADVRGDAAKDAIFGRAMREIQRRRSALEKREIADAAVRLHLLIFGGTYPANRLQALEKLVEINKEELTGTIGARLAEEGSMAFHDFYGAKLSQIIIASAEDADPETLTLLARAFDAMPRISTQENPYPFRFGKGNALIKFFRENGQVVLKLYDARDAEMGDLKALASIPLGEEMLLRAKALNMEARMAVTARPGVAQISGESPEALEAFTEEERITRANIKLYREAGIVDTKPVVLKVTFEREPSSEEISLYLSRKSQLESAVGKNIYIQFAVKRGESVESHDRSEDISSLDGLVKGTDYAVVYMAKPTTAVLAAAEKDAKAGFISLKEVGDGTVNPFVSAAIFGVAIARSTDAQKPTDTVIRMWKNLRDDPTVEMSPENFAAMRSVQKADSAAERLYKQFTLKVITKLDWQKFVEYARVAMKAVGAAA